MRLQKSIAAQPTGAELLKQIKRQLRKDQGGSGQDSELEASFDYYWRILAEGESEPVKQFKFNSWFIDRAWPEFRIAIELNGGSGGGFGRPVICHNCGVKVRARRGDGSPGKELRLPHPSHAGRGAERDAAKINALQRAGWVALVYTSAQFDNNPEAIIQEIRIEIRKAKHKQGVGSGRHTIVDQLTKREREVINMICQGLTYGQIAIKLGLEESTITKHAQNIRQKLGVPNLAAACTVAAQNGLISEFFFDQIQ